MNKLFQALLVGMLTTFILDFFLFLGVFIHYVRPLEIPLYYNILFADNQNIFLFAFFTLLFGYVAVYTKGKIALGVIALFALLSFSSLTAPIGELLGEALFKQENVHLKNTKFTYHGDILYIGRKEVTFYDYELQKVLHINKQNLQGLN